jgi:cytidylate kinase
MYEHDKLKPGIKTTIREHTTMPIITISRGSYSRGKEVAEKLADRLGYECISRDILLEASEEFNTPEIKLIRALHDAPTVLERFHYGKERYISYVRSALLQHIKEDNVVYHGLAGHFFLQDIPHVLKVRIIADIDDRVREEMKREKIPADRARYILKKDDEERRKWGISLYGIDTWDSQLYDLVIHIKALTVDDAVRIVCDTVEKEAFRTTPESRKLLSDLALAAKIQAQLVEKFPMVDVTADDGHVFIGSTGDKPTVREEDENNIKRLLENVKDIQNITFTLSPPAPQNSRHHVNPFHNI